MLYAEWIGGDDPPDVERWCSRVPLHERLPARTVWERIDHFHCPPACSWWRFSATVANAASSPTGFEAGAGPTTLVMSDHRPVPLAFSFCSAKGCIPLLNDEKTGLHFQLQVLARLQKASVRKGKSSKNHPKPEAPPCPSWWAQMASATCCGQSISSFSRRGLRQGGGATSGARRAGSASSAMAGAAVIDRRLTPFVAATPEAVRRGRPRRRASRDGPTHAGVLPAWKELIEELFRAGLSGGVLPPETLRPASNIAAAHHGDLGPSRANRGRATAADGQLSSCRWRAGPGRG